MYQYALTWFINLYISVSGIGSAQVSIEYRFIIKCVLVLGHVFYQNVISQYCHSTSVDYTDMKVNLLYVVFRICIVLIPTYLSVTPDEKSTNWFTYSYQPGWVTMHLFCILGWGTALTIKHTWLIYWIIIYKIPIFYFRGLYSWLWGKFGLLKVHHSMDVLLLHNLAHGHLKWSVFLNIDGISFITPYFINWPRISARPWDLCICPRYAQQIHG